MELKKAELRQRILASLKRDEEVHLAASNEVVKRLKELLASVNGPIGVFRSLSTEPNLEKLVKSLNKDWAFPRVEGETLSFYRSEWDELMPGAYGVFEPKAEPSRLVSIDEFNMALIPGVCFDRLGNRLGRGKAFYDKTFEFYKGAKVGVCFAEAISNKEVPYEEHDLKMDWLVTDRYILNPKAT